MLENERELLIKCQRGDTAAFGVLYDHHIRRIYDFVYYKTHHKETAEDIVSQTFLKALTHIATVDPDRSFASWLYKIAQNTVIDHYRSKRTHSDIDDAWDISDEDVDIVRDLDTASKFEEVKEHLEKLGSLERDIIIMRVWQELSYKEIADIVGKSEGNCKVIFSRAMTKLREMMPLAAFIFLFLKP